MLVINQMSLFDSEGTRLSMQWETQLNQVKIEIHSFKIQLNVTVWWLNGILETHINWFNSVYIIIKWLHIKYLKTNLMVI